MAFSEADSKALKEFGALLNNKAKFNDMSISDSIRLVTLLQSYNQVSNKVDEHIFELKKIVKPAEPIKEESNEEVK